MIDISKYKEGETFTIEGSDLIFKKITINIPRLDTKEEIYVYSTNQSEKLNWSIDYAIAKMLAKKYKIEILSKTIKSAYFDACFMSQARRKENNFFNKEVMRYIGSVKVHFNGNTYEYDRSAAIDNVPLNCIAYAPELSIKRATVAAIIDLLEIEEFSPDSNLPEYIKPVTKEDVSEETPFSEGDKVPISDLQKESIKTLLRKNKKNWSKKYESLTADEAAKLIKELQK